MCEQAFVNTHRMCVAARQESLLAPRPDTASGHGVAAVVRFQACGNRCVSTRSRTRILRAYLAVVAGLAHEKFARRIFVFASYLDANNIRRGCAQGRARVQLSDNCHILSRAHEAQQFCDGESRDLHDTT